jgi:hypothetical protein
MGTDIDQEEFGDSDYARFAERLEECLSALGRLLARPGFGAGPATVGAELELFLVDAAARPLPQNQVIRAAVADPRVTVELDRFDLELNASPVPLAGRPFAALGSELNVLLDHVAHAARGRAGRPALISILPTLTRADLGPGVMTDLPRYRALDSGLRRLRQDPFRIRINGADPLELASEDVALEGANSSFQVHLRVDPADFTRTYNAVQLATAPVLAVSGNSPTFLGHRLWQETRIALFKQSVHDRQAHGPRRRPARTALGTGWLRGGALELFTESVRLHQPLLPVAGGAGPPTGSPGSQAPLLNELRLHHGTVWRWNRAVYDPTAGGHLRIEMRALPAGPTVIDMLANAAFLIGLTLSLAAMIGQAIQHYKRKEATAYVARAQRLSAMWSSRSRIGSHTSSAKQDGGRPCALKSPTTRCHRQHNDLWARSQRPCRLQDRRAERRHCVRYSQSLLSRRRAAGLPAKEPFQEPT